MTPQTHYAKSGDLNIAYQVVGDGPFDLVFAPREITHAELMWEIEAWTKFVERLSTFSRVILFDRRGAGLSDRVSGTPTLEERMDDVRAVLDAVGSERAALFGAGDAGSMLALFAATHPERVTALVLFAVIARFAWAPDFPWGMKPEEIRSWIEDAEQRFADPEYIGDLFRRIAPSVREDPEALATITRVWRLSGGSPGTIAAFRRMNTEIDIRHVLATIQVPTLVLHRTDDQFVPHEASEYLARQIPGARYVELPGIDYTPWLGDTGPVADTVEEFLRDVWAARSWEESEPERVLATVMFTDIAGSTEKAVELGDARWRDVLKEHHAVIRRQLVRFRGNELDTAGDGFFASFDGPARAIRCACAVVDSTSQLGLGVRAGLHTGECELVDGKVAGVAVHTGARVAAHAQPGEVLVSSTVKDLVAGSGLAFEDRGMHALKGLGDWHLYAVLRG